MYFATKQLVNCHNLKHFLSLSLIVLILSRMAIDDANLFRSLVLRDVISLFMGKVGGGEIVHCIVTSDLL